MARKYMQIRGIISRAWSWPADFVKNLFGYTLPPRVDKCIICKYSKVDFQNLQVKKDFADIWQKQNGEPTSRV